MEAVSMLEQNCFNKNNQTELFENSWKFSDSLEAVEAVLTKKSVCVCYFLTKKRPKAVVRPWLMLQKIYFTVFERYIPELTKYDGISFLHQPMASGQPLKIVQRHMEHPVDLTFSSIIPCLICTWNKYFWPRTNYFSLVTFEFCLFTYVTKK